MSSLPLAPPSPQATLPQWIARLPMQRVLAAAVAFGSMLVIWHVMSLYYKPWVPDIPATVTAIVKQLRSAGFWTDFYITSLRILAAFVTASLIGALVGIAIGLNQKAEAFCQPLLALAIAVPDPVYIIFAILAFGTGEWAGYVALTVAVIPFVANILRSNVQARDKDLDAMAQIYHLPPRARFLSILVPQLVPSLLTAMRFSFALSWKLVVVVESIGQPTGIGSAIFHSFRQLRMREVAAIAIIFIIVMQLVERGVLGRLEKRLLRWRH